MIQRKWWNVILPRFVLRGFVLDATAEVFNEIVFFENRFFIIGCIGCLMRDRVLFVGLDDCPIEPAN